MAENKNQQQDSEEQKVESVESATAEATNQSQSEPESEQCETTPEDEVDENEKKIEELTQQVETMNDKYLRLSAEYDNYRKRTIKEKADLLKSAGSDVLSGLLPVMDDFERALQHMAEATDVESLRTGVELIHKKFSDFLVKKDVEEIAAKGEMFDVELHEAIARMPAPSEDMKGKVLDCVEKGYKMGDKVIRFAKVVVCD